MKLKAPDLQHPLWIQLGFLAVGIAIAMSPVVVGRAGLSFTPLLVMLGLVVGGFLIKLSPHLAVVFPNRVATVGDLARDVLALNHTRLVDEVGGWSNQDVWGALCRLIVMQSGVAPEKITTEARILEDLGIC